MATVAADVDGLGKARDTLGLPGLVARLSNLVGNPLEQGMQLLPSAWHDADDAVVTSVLQWAMQTALQSFVRSG